MTRLVGKNIIVTGGTSGIGKVSALKLAQNGANVLICGRDENKGNSVLDEILQYPVNAKFVKCDIIKKSEVDYLFKIAIAFFGNIDCLFNNVGIDGERAFFAESTEENWDSVITTNLKGTWYCMKQAISHMLINGQGIFLICLRRQA